MRLVDVQTYFNEDQPQHNPCRHYIWLNVFMPSDKNEGWEVEGKSEGIEKEKKNAPTNPTAHRNWCKHSSYQLTNHNSNN